jgi:hypothetical protein
LGRLAKLIIRLNIIDDQSPVDNRENLTKYFKIKNIKDGENVKSDDVNMAVITAQNFQHDEEYENTGDLFDLFLRQLFVLGYLAEEVTVEDYFIYLEE